MFSRSKQAKLALILYPVLLFQMAVLVLPADSLRASSVITVPDDYLTIQEAINAADLLDTILVRAGTYHEHVQINKTITLIGENSETTIIDGDGIENTPIILINRPDIEISNFTVRNTASTVPTYGILIYRTYNIKISKTTIERTYTGVMINDAYYCQFLNNTIIRNFAYGLSSQVNCSYSLFRDNIIMQNPTGVFLQGDSCRNDTFYHNSFNNTNQVASFGTGIKWDNGYPSGGNYWSDHHGTDNFNGPNQDEPGSDGIGDNPYINLGGAQDKYPLMRSWIPVPPSARFTILPTVPTRNENATFDASSSYSLNGNITSHRWNFGDGSNITSTASPLAFYSYFDFGDYNVTLTVTDTAGLNGTSTRTVQIRMKTSTLSMEVHPSTIAIGSNVTINGTLTIRDAPPTTTKTIKISYRIHGQSTWQTLTDADTNSQGKYEYVWIPQEITAYDLNATYQGDETTSLASSPVLLLTVTKRSITLTLDTNPETVFIGSTLTITGRLTPIHEGENITIGFQPLYGPWEVIATVRTNSTGDYIYEWITTKAGMGILNATWAGNRLTYSNITFSGLVRISRISSNITVTIDPPNPTIYSPANISGKITQPRGVTTVIIQIRNSNGTLVSNATTPTDASGYYKYIWQPSESGIHKIKVSWQGDEYTEPAESQTLTVSVEPMPEIPLWQYVAVGLGIAFVVLAVVFSKRKKRRRQIS
jgi:nitrous oxidase accessory protein NosD